MNHQSVGAEIVKDDNSSSRPDINYRFKSAQNFHTVRKYAQDHQIRIQKHQSDARQLEKYLL